MWFTGFHIGAVLTSVADLPIPMALQNTEKQNLPTLPTAIKYKSLQSLLC